MSARRHRRLMVVAALLAGIVAATGLGPAAAAEAERGTLRHGGQERSYLIYQPAPGTEDGLAADDTGSDGVGVSGGSTGTGRPGADDAPPALGDTGVPANADSGDPSDQASRPLRPAVFVLHGGLGSGEQAEEFSGFDALADRDGFVVIYPDGLRRQWNDGREGGPARPSVDDVGFLAALAARAVADHGADPHRLYVVGISNGGMMALRLACERSRLFAGFAAVIANLPRSLRTGCRPEVPVPVLVMAGTADPLVPFEGGGVGFLGGRGQVISARDTVGLFVDRNGCRPLPETTLLPDPRRDDGSRVRRLWHRPCRGGSEVLFYVVEGGGHTWPGRPIRGLPARLVGPTNLDIDATALIWEFFQRHALP